MKRQSVYRWCQWMQIALYGMLLCAVLFLAYSGSRLYQNVSTSKNQNEVMRGTLAYLQSQVSANAGSNIQIEDTENGSRLRISLKESGYDLLIYCEAGALMEEVTVSGKAADSKKAQVIAEGEKFTASWINQKMLQLELDGKSTFVSFPTGEAQP